MGGLRGVREPWLRLGVWSDGGLRDGVSGYGTIVALKIGLMWRVLLAVGGLLPGHTVPQCESVGATVGARLAEVLAGQWCGARVSEAASSASQLPENVELLKDAEVFELELELSMCW